MKDIFLMALSTFGAIYILIAAIGVYRMPDFYTRLTVTIKGGTLGVGCILGAVAIYFSDFSVMTRVFAIIFFIYITSPVAAFFIARTAYLNEVEQWQGTVRDELKKDVTDDVPHLAETKSNLQEEN